MLLFIVSRYQAGLYDTLQREFGSEREITIVVDRRLAQRRRGEGGQPGPHERRQCDRRLHAQVDASLRSLGWAIVFSQG